MGSLDKKIVFGPSNGFNVVAIDNIKRVMAVLDKQKYLTILFLNKSDDKYFIQLELDKNINNMIWINSTLYGFDDHNGLHSWVIEEDFTLSYKLDQITEISGEIIQISQVQQTNEISLHTIIFAVTDDGKVWLLQINEGNVNVSEFDKMNSHIHKSNILIKYINRNRILIFDTRNIQLFEIDSTNEILNEITNYSLTLTDYLILDVFIDNNNKVWVAFDNGKYSQFEIRDNEIIWKKTFFSYGPFPCQPISKIIMGRIDGFKEDISIFSGGLPSVTYGHLHPLSICRNGEPEICFTFPETIHNFDVFYQSDDVIEKILVYTMTQFVEIYYNSISRNWMSNTIYPVSSMAGSSINQISPAIEIILNDQHSNNNEDINCTKTSMNIFASYHDDSCVRLWKYSNNEFRMFDEIDLGIYCNLDVLEKTIPEILWPRFQKCGMWPCLNQLNDLVKVTDIKLSNEENKYVQLLILINKKSIYRFNIDLLNQKSEVLYSSTKKLVSFPIDIYHLSTYEIVKDLVFPKRKQKPNMQLVNNIELDNKSIKLHSLNQYNIQSSNCIVYHDYRSVYIANLQSNTIGQINMFNTIKSHFSQQKKSLKQFFSFNKSKSNSFESGNGNVASIDNGGLEIGNHEIMRLAVVDVSQYQTDVAVGSSDGSVSVYEVDVTKPLSDKTWKLHKRLVFSAGIDNQLFLEIIQGNLAEGTLKRSSTGTLASKGSAEGRFSETYKTYILAINDYNVKLMRYPNLKTRYKYKISQNKEQKPRGSSSSGNSSLLASNHNVKVLKATLIIDSSCSTSNMCVLYVNNESIILLSLSRLVVLKIIELPSDIGSWICLNTSSECLIAANHNDTYTQMCLILSKDNSEESLKTHIKNLKQQSQGVSMIMDW